MTNDTPSAPDFLSLATLAREAGIPDATARRHVAKLGITPDAVLVMSTQRRMPLFNATRAPAIADALSAHATQ